MVNAQCAVFPARCLSDKRSGISCKRGVWPRSVIHEPSPQPPAFAGGNPSFPSVFLLTARRESLGSPLSIPPEGSGPRFASLRRSNGARPPRRSRHVLIVLKSRPAFCAGRTPPIPSLARRKSGNSLRWRAFSIEFIFQAMSCSTRVQTSCGPYAQ